MHSLYGKESNTAKGVKTETEFNEGNNILVNKKVIRNKMRRIQSKKLGTYEVRKILFSCLDDKNYILNDGANMFAYFHKDCKKQ